MSNKKFKHLISTMNPVELDMIRFALNNKGIEVQTESETALTVGNVELTGAGGASIKVPKEDFEDAKKVLIELGLDQQKSHLPTDKRRMLSPFMLIAIFLILLMIILYYYFNYSSLLD